MSVNFLGNILFYKKILSKKLPDYKEMEKIPLVDDTTDEFDNLTDCDQIIQIFKKVQSTKLRFKTMLFAHTFKEPCLEILKMGDILLNFFIQVKKSTKFRRWLEYILAFGNYMNGIGFYGGAYGFKMDAFEKIFEVNSVDNNKTLMTFIIETIGKNVKDRDLLDYFTELSDLQEGKKMISLTK